MLGFMALNTGQHKTTFLLKINDLSEKNILPEANGNTVLIAEAGLQSQDSYSSD